ncbi:hypothetical protein GCM10007972_17070 [Iodidimonas muriae]|uniref:Beta-lactamase hydrolase-like protein phosphatase-like domain-containing protein n=1 Tax=Iodidimonas muriae TaxID=261467 RepID=A0ABQ2LFI2_9PROT|nr:TIGR01244 family sulfur transferase [Iodidimonas muriae]GER07818.1 hypothetical protein JCM17843_21280 [Kordiimonadales bacterium JCM 17843]GGO12291.1 hypothetical protein GCM10007972_17070 [Iodidimonas muriae]
MDIKKIDNSLSVSAQIRAEDIPALKDQGFRGIICNRPDGESADQPAFKTIEAAATAAGLEIRYVPIINGQVRDEDIALFDHSLRDLPGPILAYCRSGTRSAMLWSLSQARGRPLDDILAATKAAGYDMSGIARQIAKHASPDKKTLK